METMEKIAHRLGNAVLVGALFASVSAFLFSMSASLSLAQEEIDTFVEEDFSAFQEPMMGQQEMRDFLNQFKDVQREAKKVSSDLKGLAGPEADAWKQRLQAVEAHSADCAKRMSGASDENTKIEIRDECHSLGLWDEVNDIREQFVPPQEIKNATNDIKRQMNEIKRMERKLKKLKLDAMQKSLTELLNKLGAHHAGITKSAGAEQREALQNYWDAQLWEEINAFNARVNIPDELTGAKKDLARVDKQLGQTAYKNAIKYFEMDVADFADLAASKKTVIAEIESLLGANDAEGAQELMREHFHEYGGWHPGELQHLLNMFRDMQQRLKRVRDKQVNAAINELLQPIIDATLEGDVRGARETMEELARELQKYENYFFKLHPKGLGKKTQTGLDNLQSLIQKKFALLKEQGEKKPAAKESGMTEETKQPMEIEEEGDENGSEVGGLKQQLNEALERNKNLEAQLEKLTQQLDKLLSQKSE
ncbi:hypothetical protein HYV71_04115 [Candidatus Uhrbacteria bacterium]|nr:hypothetical protein [Candidatus Uhrbacteria bacterium]